MWAVSALRGYSLSLCVRQYRDKEEWWRVQVHGCSLFVLTKQFLWPQLCNLLYNWPSMAAVVREAPRLQMCVCVCGYWKTLALEERWGRYICGKLTSINPSWEVMRISQWGWTLFERLWTRAGLSASVLKVPTYKHLLLRSEDKWHLITCLTSGLHLSVKLWSWIHIQNDPILFCTFWIQYLFGLLEIKMRGFS